ncbi:UNVERIFIED_CONTAM: hypothetical protein Slati_3508100 [Sesamum latifolium]|uniref:Reverse transcriptase zinc-binding domain-containing protein n=1 Tax=Sesamum latifolium TaxID=2727402 RepID=A0AAW2UK70_9LAMI
MAVCLGVQRQAESFTFRVEVCPKCDAYSFQSLREGTRVEGGCLGCGADTEELVHVLWQCCIARLSWALSNLPWRVIEYRAGSTENWMRAAYWDLRGPEYDYFLAICWALWRERNNWLFEGSVSKAHEIVGFAKRCCITNSTSTLDVQSRGVG